MLKIEVAVHLYKQTIKLILKVKFPFFRYQNCQNDNLKVVLHYI